MKIDLCTINWVSVSALVSFAMVVITSLSLRQMKRQWNAERRPRLNFSIIISQRTWYVLKISNVGKQNAYNVNASFNEDFLNVLRPDHKLRFERLQSPFAIEAGCSKYYLFCAIEDWKNECARLSITGKYCNKYIIDENICIDEYITGSLKSLIVDDKLTEYIGYIKEGLIVQNNQYFPIQKSLSIIAKEMSKKSPYFKSDEAKTQPNEG